MKKQITFLFIAGLALTAIPAIAGEWVKTAEGQLDCSKVSVHKATTQVTLATGEKKNIPTSDIESYSVKGKEYVRKPFYEKGNIKSTVFMEFVKTMDDMSLYKFTDMENSLTRYYMFKDGDYYMEITPASMKEFAAFFK